MGGRDSVCHQDLGPGEADRRRQIWYRINTNHLNISSIDIFSDHFYPMNLAILSQGTAQVQSVGKVYLAAEYGLDATIAATRREDGGCCVRL
ncbi:hypothetical protein J1614_000107 [Plenodomus biglobosus]|nr:hypothetical protein J1614_000107 [Plenodomus biglobosus]